MVWILGIAFIGVVVFLIVKNQSKLNNTTQQNMPKKLCFKNGIAAYEYSKKYLSNLSRFVRGQEYCGIITEIDNNQASITIIIGNEEYPVITRRMDFQNNVWNTLSVGDFVIYVPITILVPDVPVASAGVISCKIANTYKLPNDGWETEWAFNIKPLVDAMA